MREFQRNVGLAPDGIAGPEVFAALNRLARTVAGGRQEHLRELASWDAGVRPYAVTVPLQNFAAALGAAALVRWPALFFPAADPPPPRRARRWGSCSRPVA